MKQPVFNATTDNFYKGPKSEIGSLVSIGRKGKKVKKKRTYKATIEESGPSGDQRVF